MKPADIKVTLSSPEFEFQTIPNAGTVNIPGGTMTTAPTSLIFVGTCTFANNGAETGAITDIAVQFQSDDGTQWTFLPYFLADDALVVKSNGHTLYKLDNLPGFSTILIAGKQTASHRFIFAADDFKSLEPHRFHVKLFTWSGADTKPREQQLSTLDVNWSVVATLKGGSKTGVAFEEQRQRLQQLLK